MDANASANGIKFHYFWNKQDHQKKVSRGHGGIITTMTALNKDTQTMKVAFAYCSPKDTFNRKIAHKICEGRINSKHYVEIPFSGNSFIDTAKYFNDLDNKFKPNFCRDWTINEENGSIFC